MTGQDRLSYRSLDEVPTDLRIDRKSYDRQLKELQVELQKVQTAYITQQRRAVIVLEGWDAAGKGGTIKRLTSALDPRFFKVWPIAAPSQDEGRRHYLYRFWTRLPGNGEIAIFDRSWYGRVLVERVEGFASEPEWRRAYTEINEFEALLAADGSRVVKLFLHINPDEQARRFIERMEDPVKRWKFTADDLRNRAHWDAYYRATQDMLTATATAEAPWHVLPYHQKRYGRLAAIRVILDRLSAGLVFNPPPLDPDLLDQATQELGGPIRPKEA